MDSPNRGTLDVIWLEMLWDKRRVVTVLPAGWLSWGSSSRIGGSEGPFHLQRGSVCPSGHTVPQPEGTNSTETGPSSIPAAPQVNTCLHLSSSFWVRPHFTEHIYILNCVMDQEESDRVHAHMKNTSLCWHLIYYTQTFMNSFRFTSLHLTPPPLIRHKEHGSRVLTPLNGEVEPGCTIQEVAEAGRVTLWCQVRIQ